MSTKTTAGDRVREPRIVRRICYLIIGTIGLVAVIVGVATTEQVDAFTASAAVTAIVNYISAYFTKKGADSTATDSELAAARAEAQARVSASDSREAIMGRLNDLADVLPDRLLAAIRAEERGEHDTAAGTAATATATTTATTDYVYGR